MATERLREAAKALFEYLRELSQLNQQTVLDVRKQQGCVFLHQINNPSYVHINSRDTLSETSENGELLIKFQKPDFTPCPPPDRMLLQWLLPGWDDFRRTPAHHDFIEIEVPTDQLLLPEADEQGPDARQENHQAKKILFEDDPSLVSAYETWVVLRADWAQEQKVIQDLRSAFTDLFDMYNLLRQYPDTLEFMVGNGRITDKMNREIDHPLFLKRMRIELDSVRNTLLISDTDEPPRIYLPLISTMEDVNADVIPSLEKKAEDADIHPLDHNEGGDLLKSVAHQLHTSNLYIGPNDVYTLTEERIVVRWDPILFLRKRTDGTIKALESIIKAVENGAPIPGSLTELLGGDPDVDIHFEDNPGPLAEDSSSTSGSDVWQDPESMPLEDESMLLPKPANREQMQIVRKIEHSSAVLVQGPPGTGKTHTIANLLGHFLAQGKTVLVTSKTPKALSVLKDKVPKELQALCVALLGDNRADMEASVNAIIERTTVNSLSHLQAQAELIRKMRHETLQDLQKARDLVYAIRHKEFEPIVYLGDSYSPAAAAKFVFAHQDLMKLIPGNVNPEAAFPLDDDELEFLYTSNALITSEEDAEISSGLPDPDALMKAAWLASGLDAFERLSTQLNNLNASRASHLEWNPARMALVDSSTDSVYITQGSPESEKKLTILIAPCVEEIPGWAVRAITDGAETGLARKKWEQLIELIDETYTKAQAVLENQLKRPVRILSSDFNALIPQYRELLEKAEKNGHVNKNSLFLKKDKKEALAAITINLNTPEYAQDFRDVLAYLELLSMRERLGQLWDYLVAANGAAKFSAMGEEPERVCWQQKEAITYWMNWSETSMLEINNQGRSAGIGEDLLRPLSNSAAVTDEKVAAMLTHIKNTLHPMLHLVHLVNELCSFTTSKQATIAVLKQHADLSSTCREAYTALGAESVHRYELALEQLTSLLGKKDIQAKREELLKKLTAAAPGWAQAVKQREGVHGGSTVPSELRTAWKTVQLAAQVDLITKIPLREAEEQVNQQTKRYRQLTENYACILAWQALQQRIDANQQMRQILNGWKQTIVKIGKGTGKHAPALRAEARKLMIECQKAVPAWIMPVANVMSSVDPSTTKFDVIIIDEASQSDVTATAILYMGKKIIVVGDDEQVSPLSVGLDEDKMQLLIKMLIKGKIPNAHLWDSKTSLYDIAAQSYSPLMLREHFRCVPDIIGYSNGLSYQGKIKPLREAGSSAFKTATISYRVNGIKNNKSKTNIEEAEAVVALIQACIEQPEYQNSSFGVISLLGDEQAKLINHKLAEQIPLHEYEKHRILCGNASNFQGDERDVIFLSMVDSRDSGGPLPMMSGDGAGATGKPLKQRYNVAVSRARDQLWVVHSLDYTADLKPGDMRRGLLEYVTNPKAHEQIIQNIEDAADSPFESEVAIALVSQGYHIDQQWPVGAYRLDIVARFNGSRVAIECDGERWHSGEGKIRADMERQAILERLGWRFIRIRGSEYFRDRSGTIARVVEDLNKLGIFPETTEHEAAEQAGNDSLLERVKQRADALLKGDSTSAETDCTVTLGASEKMNLETETSKTIPVPSTSVYQAPRPKPVRRAPMPPSVQQKSSQASKQTVLNSPSEDLCSVLQQAGFTCIDNRGISGILWALYDPTKIDLFKALEAAHDFHSVLERRGAVATNGKPAWRILKGTK